MTQAYVEAALETALNAITPSLSTAWRNKAFVPVVGTPYQRVSFLHAEPDNPEMGDGHQLRGYMQIDLFYPQNDGPGAARNRAELLRTTFARGNSFTESTTTTIIERTPNISDGTVDGDRWRVTVQVRFFANHF